MSMKNFIVRHETCHECHGDIPVWEYAPYNHDDYIRVLADEKVVALCTGCWNRLFERISFTERGWMLDTEMRP